jgi:lambda family phage minor tail protein L
MTTQYQQAISSQPGAIVTLFDLDLTVIGVAQTLHFTSSNSDTIVPPIFQGVAYTPVELKSSGWARSGNGPFPQPTIQVSNVNDLFSGLVRQYQDLIGAKLVRKRLFRSFLDDGTNAGQGANAIFAVDTYYLYQKTAHNKLLVEWKLASSLDQEGQQLPARQVVRDSCQFSYRIWNPAFGFDYTHVECPYTGGAAYDTTGAGTSVQLDACGKRISDCKLRFGGAGFLPFGGFPGVNQG